MSHIKTNVMRILDQKKIEYNITTYDNKDGKIDGVSVAAKIGKDPKFVFKTLVCQGHSKDFYVFVIPVHEELDLKKAARVSKEKSIDMVAVKDIQKLTGYVRGGCSPIGMKKEYITFLDSSALSLDKIIVSGGKIGFQVELKAEDLIKAVDAKFEDITK